MSHLDACIGIMETTGICLLALKVSREWVQPTTLAERPKLLFKSAVSTQIALFSGENPYWLSQVQ